MGRFITGLLLGLAIALGAPAQAETPGQTPGPSDPPVFDLEGCSQASTSVTFTVTRGNRTREVTVTKSPCEGGFVLVTRYKSPWVPLPVS